MSLQDISPERSNYEKVSSNINAIAPVNQNENQSEEKIRLSTSYLFLSKFSKSNKSYDINVTNDRIIHVEHYAHHDEDLFPDEYGNTVTPNDTTAVVLFFIHGVGGSSKMWESQIQYFLSKGYEIVTLDLLGHGSSSKPHSYKSYHFKELANDVLVAFDRFHKQNNVLIGHSYGTSFCTYLAKERRSLISKLIMISGGGPTTLKPDQCSPFCLPYPLFYIFSPAVVKIFRRWAFHVETSSRIREKIRTFGLSPFVLKAIMQGQVWNESDEEYHADLDLPVLLIHGIGDQLISLDEEQWMNDTIQGSQLVVIDDAGHMVTIEKPAMVNTSIYDFLNRDSSTAAWSLKERNNHEEILDERPSFEEEQESELVDLASRSSISVRESVRTPGNERATSRVSVHSRAQSRLSQRSSKLTRCKTMY